MREYRSRDYMVAAKSAAWKVFSASKRLWYDDIAISVAQIATAICYDEAERDFCRDKYNEFNRLLENGITLNICGDNKLFNHNEEKCNCEIILITKNRCTYILTHDREFTYLKEITQLLSAIAAEYKLWYVVTEVIHHIEL